MTTPEIAIVGGGPCGLTLARLLECKGIDYVVYERDENHDSTRAGGSLDIHAETGQQALREGGLLEEFKKIARYDDMGFQLADKLGNRLFQIGQGRDAPEIDRGELRQILLDSIPKDKIRWGHALKSATLNEHRRPVLQFSNDAVVSGFKLVVGTDGAWSKVRPLITKAVPDYSGKSIIESRINRGNPHYEIMASKIGPGTCLSVGSGHSVVTQRQGDGSYRTYFGLRVPENFFHDGTVDLQNVAATRNLLLSRFYGDWGEEYKDLIRHATDFRPWTLHSLSTEDMNWKSVPGVTLAGDAAHLSMPNGEGVNLGLFDSLQLASQILKHGFDKLDQAVQEYEAEMRPRGAASIADGKQMTDVMYGEDPQAMLQILSGATSEEDVTKRLRDHASTQTTK